MIPLLMTRPVDRSKRFVQGLPDALHALVEPHFAPMWRMQGAGAAPDFDAAIITSRNGVIHGPDAAGRRAYCVGAATTAHARAAGWDATEVGPTADALVAGLLQDPPTGRLMHLSGARTRGAVADRLRAAGLTVQRHIAYTQHKLPLSPDAQTLLQAAPVLVPLFSPDGAAHFAAQAPPRAQAHIAAISAATAAALGNHAARDLVVASTPDAQSLGNALYSQATKLLAG